MAITVSCPWCKKTYQLSDSLAGKKGRCKQCDTTFEIPAASGGELYDEPVRAEPVGAALPRSAPSRDVFAGLAPRRDVFDDLLPRAGSPLPPALPADLPPPPRGPKPRTTSAVPRRRGDYDDPLYRNAWGCISIGALIFTLPFVGLQFKGLHLMGPHTQAIAGVVVVLIGGVLMLCSSPPDSTHRTIKWVTVISLGIAGAASVPVYVVPHWNEMWGEVQPPAPAPNPPPAMPGFNPGGAPPRIPGFNPGGPPPGFPNNRDAAPNPRYIISDAHATRDSDRFGARKELSFRANYRLEGQRPMPGSTLIWMIESSRTKAQMRIFNPQMSGTVSGALAFDQGDTGPFRCYFVLQRFGPGGQTQDTVSDTVEMQFHAAPLNNPNPGVGNMPPGMNMPNPNTNPNPNPNPNPNGMPPFGRRGAPPRPPGFPPGFPRRP